MHYTYDPATDRIGFERNPHPLEVRFKAAMKELHFDKNSKRNRKQEMEIDHLVRHVRRYGFVFFPEMYVTDEVAKLEEIVKKRATQNNKEPKK